MRFHAELQRRKKSIFVQIGEEIAACVETPKKYFPSLLLLAANLNNKRDAGRTRRRLKGILWSFLVNTVVFKCSVSE